MLEEPWALCSLLPFENCKPVFDMITNINCLKTRNAEKKLRLVCHRVKSIQSDTQTVVTSSGYMLWKYFKLDLHVRSSFDCLI